MKSIYMFITALIAMSALQSFAEVKPQGTVLPFRCSKAVQMYDINPAVLIAPVNSVCFASVVGMGQQFMLVDKEIFAVERAGVSFKLTLVGEVGARGSFVPKQSRVKVEMEGIDDRTGTTIMGKYYKLRIPGTSWQNIVHTM